MIKTATHFPKPTKDWDRHLVEAFTESAHLRLDGHPNTVHALQPWSLEDDRRQTSAPLEVETAGTLRDLLLMEPRAKVLAARCSLTQDQAEPTHPEKHLHSSTGALPQ